MPVEEAADCDCCIIDRGNLCPNPNIEGRGAKDICGWTGWLLPYPEMLGCEGEAEIICCLLLPLLLATEGPTPDAFIGGVAPAVPKCADIMRDRSAPNLCFALSTCSHSFISNVSISANCFSFNSSLFNCQKQQVTKLNSSNYYISTWFKIFSKCLIYWLLQNKFIW